jgi:syntaxin 1B/2/3
MQPYGQQAAPAAGGAAAPGGYTLSQQDFLSRVAHVRSEIRSLTADVQEIAALHQRSLTSSDGSAAQQLEALISQTQIKNGSIRDQIQRLKQDTERTTDGSRTLKMNQFRSLNKDFKEEVGKYLQEEQNYREKYREQIARQFLIVNPEATQEQVNQVVDSDLGNEGIFQQAVCGTPKLDASIMKNSPRSSSPTSFLHPSLSHPHIPSPTSLASRPRH